MILSSAMLLDHIGETARAKKVRDAVGAVIEAGEVRVYDMMKIKGGPEVLSAGAASTIQMTDAIIARL